MEHKHIEKETQQLVQILSEENKSLKAIIDVLGENITILENRSQRSESNQSSPNQEWRTITSIHTGKRANLLKYNKHDFSTTFANRYEILHSTVEPVPSNNNKAANVHLTKPNLK